VETIHGKGIEMKYLVVEMSDGTEWAIPAILIVKNRAEYYATLDAKSGAVYGDTYTEEIESAMSDEYEITNWAANNMNWVEVCAQAILLKVDSPKADYTRDWVNAPKSVKEIEL
jgi:hypothetical protein